VLLGELKNVAKTTWARRWGGATVEAELGLGGTWAGWSSASANGARATIGHGRF
jgi:hypothetical protein